MIIPNERSIPPRPVPPAAAVLFASAAKAVIVDKPKSVAVVQAERASFTNVLNFI
jgi:hypothetical protein